MNANQIDDLISKPINCVNSSLVFDKSSFLLPSKYEDCIEEIIVPEGLIQSRVQKIASDIVNVFKREELHLICVLSGSSRFFQDLMKCINDIELVLDSEKCTTMIYPHFIQIKSYVNTTVSDNVRMIYDDLSVVKDKHVIIVEDVIDTGNTLSIFTKFLEDTVNPKSVCIASLLLKHGCQTIPIKPKFLGFIVPSSFLVGYGLDYNQRFRNLDHVCVISKQTIKKYAVEETQEKKI